MALSSKTRLGTYEIVDLLGAGGMVEVYRAKDLRLGREVAVKVLPAEVASSPDRLARLEREARTVAGLNHPNIVTLLTVEDASGVRFLTMELVEGQTLSDRLKRGPLAEDEVRRLGSQLADGLAAAHRRGVLHRDIKPGNLRVTPDGVLKILDFGLAKIAGPTTTHARTETLSETGTTAGTLPYMSPEQVRAEALTEATDIFAAGAVLYEMATGRRSFPQESAGAVMGAILAKEPKKPRELQPSISAGLERIILRCLEKDAAARYPSASELALALR